MHHIVVDDWSLAVLASDLAELYAAAVASRLPALPPLRVQYPDIAAWQRARLREDHCAYWRDQLTGMPTVLEIPADRPRPRRRDIRGGRVDFDVSAEVTARLRQLGRRHGATLFMSLLAGFEVLISRYTGERDFGVGTPVAGREHPDTACLIGFFVNTLVMRARLWDDPTFGQLLDRVRATA